MMTGQAARLTSMSLILLMALVGLSPFGQTSTQFMMGGSGTGGTGLRGCPRRSSRT